MSKPNNILYNYRSTIMAVPAPNALTALVDHGFRSWSMRQFRLAGVQVTEPRSVPRGPARDALRERLEKQRQVLEHILMKDSEKGINVLLSPEKPTFSGQFCAHVFVPFMGKSSTYTVKYCDSTLFDVGGFMRDVCSEKLSVDVAFSFIRDVKPASFIR